MDFKKIMKRLATLGGIALAGSSLFFLPAAWNPVMPVEADGESYTCDGITFDQPYVYSSLYAIETGNYYLTEDTDLTDTSAGFITNSSTQVNLYLNGYTLTVSSVTPCGDIGFYNDKDTGGIVAEDTATQLIHFSGSTDSDITFYGISYSGDPVMYGPGSDLDITLENSTFNITDGGTYGAFFIQKTDSNTNSYSFSVINSTITSDTSALTLYNFDSVLIDEDSVLNSTDDVCCTFSNSKVDLKGKVTSSSTDSSSTDIHAIRLTSCTDGALSLYGTTQISSPNGAGILVNSDCSAYDKVIEVKEKLNFTSPVSLTYGDSFSNSEHSLIYGFDTYNPDAELTDYFTCHLGSYDTDYFFPYLDEEHDLISLKKFAITTEPTDDDKTVEANHEVTYQWYKKSTIGYSLTDSDFDSYTGTYDAEDKSFLTDNFTGVANRDFCGFTMSASAKYGITCTGTSFMFFGMCESFELSITADDVNLTSEDCTVNYGTYDSTTKKWTASAVDGGYYAIMLSTSDSVTFKATFDKDIRLYSAEDSNYNEACTVKSRTIKNFLGLSCTFGYKFTINAYVPLTGETSATLSSVEPGVYSCQVTMDDYSLYSDAVKTALSATKQPAYSNGYEFKVENDTNVSYQWYKAGDTDVIQSSMNTGTLGDLTSAGEYYCVASTCGLTLASDKVKVYELSFDANGGTGSVSSLYQKDSSSSVLPETIGFSMTDYVVKEWNTKADGSGTAYSAGASVSVTADTIYYAIWEEDKASVSITETAQSYTYNGSAQGFVLDGTDKALEGFTIQYYVSEAWTESAPSAAGSYNVKITRAADSLYKAYDKTIENGLVIGKLTVTATLCDDDFTYDGTDQIASLTATYVNVSGKTVSMAVNTCIAFKGMAKNTGTIEEFKAAQLYAVYFGFATEEEKNNYTVSAYHMYTMKVASVTKPASDTTGYTYSGSEQTYVIAANDLYTVEGNKKTNAGTYTVTVTLKDTSNSKWEDNSTDALTYTFEIAKCKANEPSAAASSFTYDGTEKTLVVTGVTSYMTTSDSLKATSVGSYTVTYTLADTDNYEWADGSDGILAWTITKGAAVITVDTTKITKTYDGTEVSIPTASTTFGSVTVTKSEESFINVGTYTVTYTVTGTDNYTGDTKTLEVEITKATYDMSAVQFENASYVYDGTEKTITITGTLPEGVTVAYASNALTNAGSVTAKATFTGSDNYNAIADMSAVLTITKGAAVITVDTTKITKTYDSTEPSIPTATTSFGSVTVTKSASSFINVGSYTVTYTVAGTDNYTGDTKTLEVEITKADYDMSAVQFENASYVYDGTEKTITITGTLPASVTVAYASNALTNAGSVTAKATFTGSDNYNAIDDMTAVLTITKATYDMSAVQFENASYVYDGTEKTMTITGTLPEGVTVAYATNTLTNAGSVTAKATFTGSDNYNAIDDMSAVLTITKADYDMSAVQFVNASYVYDGTEKTITITGTLPNGVTVAYASNALTNAGSVTATAVFTGSDNYNAIDDMSAVLTITKADYDMSAVQFENASYVYDGTEKTITITGTLPNGVTVAYVTNTLTNAGSITATAVFTGSDNYNAIDDMTAVMTITKGAAVITVDTAKITKTYDGRESSIPTASTNLGTVTVTKSEESFITVGTYTVTYTVEGTDNYDGDTKTLEVEIIKASYDMSNAKWNYTDAFTYDGKEKKTEVSGLPEGVTASYADNVKTNAGTYTAKVTFTIADTDNYNVPSMDDLSWTISKGAAVITVDTTTITVTEGTGVTLPSATSTFGEVTCDKTASDFTEVGTYTVTYAVEGTENYAGDTKTLKVVVKATRVTEPDDDGEVTIDTPEGIDPDAVIKVTVEVKVEAEITDTKPYQNDSVSLAKNEYVSAVFDVKLYVNGVEVQPSDLGEGTKLTIEMILPESVDVSKLTRILHVHSESDIESIVFSSENYDAETRTYTIDDVTKLSSFVFVYERSGISGGAVAGITAGSVLGLLLIIYILGYFFLYRRGHLDDSAIRVIYKWLPRGTKGLKKSPARE